MSNLSESIFESMNIFYNSALDKEKIPKMIEATIVEIIDPTIGLYLVKYLGEELRAYSNNTAIKYNANDIVLLSVKMVNLTVLLLLLAQRLLILVYMDQTKTRKSISKLRKVYLM